MKGKSNILIPNRENQLFVFMNDGKSNNLIPKEEKKAKFYEWI